MDTYLRYGLLGFVSVWRGTDEIDVGPVKQRALLAVLVLHHGQPVSQDRIIDCVWGDNAPASVVNLVHKHVSRLRRVVEPLRRGAGHGYVLDATPDQIDLRVFEEHVRRARADRAAGRLTEAAVEFRRAQEQWRGPALDGIAGPYFDTVRAQLAERRLTAVEDRIEVDLDLGRHGELVAELSGLAADFPLRERIAHALMLALYRCGRQAEALAAYRDTRRHLVAELSVEPGAALRDLHQRILAGDPDLAPAPAPVEAPRPAQLPADIADFTGRDEQVARLLGPAADTPNAVAVSVITGPGGAGKSMLAIHVAHLMRPDFPDGQLFVRLGLSRTDVLRGLLVDLGVRPGDVPDDESRKAAMYRSVLADKRVLIVLDDASDAGQVVPLLPGSPTCRVLVTSRTPLTELPGVAVVRLGPVSSAEAKRLLSSVAGAERLAAEPTATDEVLRACAGLPLALRIAGARLARRPGWPVRTLARLLADRCGRLDELAVGDLAVRSTFQTSYDQLTTPLARRVMRFLGWTDGPDLGLDGLAVMLDVGRHEVQRAAEALVDACLVESTQPDRYRLHDLVRLFAHEQAERDEARPDLVAGLGRLCVFYQTTTRHAGEFLYTSALTVPPATQPGNRFGGRDAAHSWLDVELPTMLAVSRQGARVGVPTGVVTELVRSLRSILHYRGEWTEWESVTRVTLNAAMAVGDNRSSAVLCMYIAQLSRVRRQLDKALDEYERALELFVAVGDEFGQGRALQGLSATYSVKGAWAQAWLFGERSLRLRRRLGDRPGEAVSLNNLAMFASNRYAITGDLSAHPEAVRNAERSLEIQREIGPEPAAGIRLCTLGTLYNDMSQYAQARDVLTRGLSLVIDQGNQVFEAFAHLQLGRASTGLGQPREAADHLERCLRIYLGVGHELGQAEALQQLGATLAAFGQRARAGECLAKSLALYRKLRAPEAEVVEEKLASLVNGRPRATVHQG